MTSSKPGRFNRWAAVYWFELWRSLSKRSFWIRTLAVPVMIGAVLGLSVFSAKVGSEADEALKATKIDFAVFDESGLVSPAVVAAAGGVMVQNTMVSAAQVRDGKLEAFIYYPKDPSTQKTEVVARDAGLMDNSKYTSLAQQLIQTSLAGRLGSPEAVTLFQGGLNVNLTTYDKGQPTKGFGRVVAPGLFLVLMYVVIVLLGNQMLTSTTEEKENRVVELLLTSMPARTLMSGKLWALVTMGFIQILALLLPVVVAYVGWRSQLKLPDFDLASISLAPGPIISGAILLAGGFLMFTGLLVTIGAAVPTAKEASGYFGAAIIAMFLPFYALTAVVSSPGQLLVTVLTYFPLTAPITLMMRNAVGNASWQTLAIGTVIVWVTALFLMRLAVRTFQYGSLEYARKLSLKELIRSARS